MKKLNKGAFIVFEGAECSGKSTQSQLCFDYFSKNYDTIKVREPGSSKVSEEIRNILLHKKDISMLSLTELMLYEAARVQFVEETLKPALKENKLVLCDRYYYSTIAYQGFGGNLRLEEIERLNKIASQGIKPDLAFIFDISYEELCKRMEKSGRVKDRMESKPNDFHNRVIDGYRWIAKRYRESILLDGKKDIQILNLEVRGTIEEFLQNRL